MELLEMWMRPIYLLYLASCENEWYVFDVCIYMFFNIAKYIYAMTLASTPCVTTFPAHVYWYIHMIHGPNNVKLLNKVQHDALLPGITHMYHLVRIDDEDPLATRSHCMCCINMSIATTRELPNAVITAYSVQHTYVSLRLACYC